MSTYYIAPSAVGAGNGTSCANADSWTGTYITTAGNWTPGTTFYLCPGIYIGSTNGTGITTLGNGSSGNPITIQLDPAASMQAPYWGGNGAIFCNGNNFITITGTGSIQNTAAGTVLGNQTVNTIGLSASGCSNLTISNITISNIYVRTSGDTNSDGSTSQCIVIIGGDSILVSNTHLSQARRLVNYNFNSVTSARFTEITGDYFSQGILVGDSTGGTASVAGVSIDNNTMGTHGAIWGDCNDPTTPCSMHASQIFFFTNDGSTVTNANIYNNNLQSDMCPSGPQIQNCSGLLFTQGVEHTNIFNNLIVATGFPQSEILLGHSGGGIHDNSNILIANNTSVGNWAIVMDSSGINNTITLENNIWVTQNGITANPNNFNSLGTVNYNLDNMANWYGAFGASGSPTFFYTFASWQGQGFDLNGTSSPALLNSNYTLQSSSPARSLGTNLTSLGITQLNSDANGVARPSTGPWDAGAFQFAAPPPPPTPPASFYIGVF